MFDVRCSVFGVRCSVFDVRCSPFLLRSPLNVDPSSSLRCSMFGVGCSMFPLSPSLVSLPQLRLAARHSPPPALPLLLPLALRFPPTLRRLLSPLHNLLLRHFLPRASAHPFPDLLPLRLQLPNKRHRLPHLLQPPHKPPLPQRAHKLPHAHPRRRHRLPHPHFHLPHLLQKPLPLFPQTLPDRLIPLPHILAPLTHDILPLKLLNP